MSGVQGMIAIMVSWTFGWGLGFGGFAEVFVDPSGETQDIWPAEMAIPGIVGGVIFAVLLRVGEGRRSLGEVPLLHYTAWGVTTGLALDALSIATGGPIPLSLSTFEMLGLATALATVAAIGSGVSFRVLAQGPSSLFERRS